jgi:hypothetical protein
MTQIINTTNIQEIDFITGRTGEYRAISKVRAGFMVVVEDLGIQNKWSTGAEWKKAIDVFRNFKKGALQTIQFRADGTDHWLTVFAKAGTKIKIMDAQMFRDMEVGDINQNWSNTNLCDHRQYAMVNAKTWASKAFVKNAA